MTRHTTTLAAAAAVLIAGPALAQTELSFGMQDAETHPLYKGAVEFKERLEELSGGEITVTIFPSAQLGDFKAMIAQMQAGEIDIVAAGYPDMSYMIPELALVGEPYVIRDFEHLQKVVEGEFGLEIDAKLQDEGINMLDLWYYGTRQTTANQPIESMEDLQGLRLRTPNVPFLIDYAEAVGATPAPVAFQEVYLALQTNQVDAQENPLPTIEAMKFYEVQDNIALTNHFIASSAIYVSGDTWESLSDQEKEWVQTAIEAGGDLNDQLLFDQEASLVQDFRDRGLTVTEPDLAPFREAMQPYYDELEAEHGEGRIEKIMAVE
jgi:tripartite ATP-independent transporter DctP family solute receptor